MARGVSEGFLILLACCAIGLSALPAATALETRQGGEKQASSNDIVTLLRKAKIVGEEAELKVKIKGADVVVSTERNLRAKDDDCKIDAVLVAKTVIFSPLGKFNKVTVKFLDPSLPETGEVWQADVSAAEVEQFKAGNLNEEALLKLVELQKKIPEKSQAGISNTGQASLPRPPVVPGPLMGARQNARQRLSELESKNLPVKKIKAMFETLENSAGNNDKKAVQSGVRLIWRALSSQEGEFNRDHSAEKGGLFSDPLIFGETMSTEARLKSVLNELGQEAPANGPRFRSRCFIAYRLKKLSQEGYLVFHQRVMFAKIEELAAENDREALDQAISEIEKELRMPHIADDN